MTEPTNKIPAELEVVDEATETSKTPKKTVKAKTTATLQRKQEDDLTVDANNHIKYTLLNGKKLDVDINKPDLEISTMLSDAAVYISNDTTHQSVQVNNLGVYRIVLENVIAAILVDKKPLSDVSFHGLTEVGVTKAELDDLMTTIVTFCLSD